MLKPVSASPVLKTAWFESLWESAREWGTQVMPAGPTPGKAEGRAACSGGAVAMRPPEHCPGLRTGWGPWGNWAPWGTEGALRGGGVPV